MKTRIQHPEHRIQPRHKTSGCAWTRKLEKGEDTVGWRPGRPSGDWNQCAETGRNRAKVGLSGFKRAEYAEFAPRKCLITRFNPLQPASTRMNFLMRKPRNAKRIPPPPLPRARARGRGHDHWAIIPRASLADSLLSVAPMGLSIAAPSAGDRIYVKKSADCYGLLRESSRKFAQIRAVNPQCYALLRVGLIF